MINTTSHNDTDLPNDYLVIRARTSAPHKALVIIDIVINIFFTLDYIVRWSVSPHKGRFCINLYNIIDLLVIIPSLLFLVSYGTFNVFGVRIFGSGVATLHSYIILRGARLLRVLWLFRLAKTRRTIRIVLLSWKGSHKELLLLAGLLTIVSVVYGSLIFFVEGREAHFDNIPTGMWWSITTMTTVGYGDISPVTAAGYVIGILCAVTGLVVVATPIPVIVNNFSALAEAIDVNIELAKRKKQIELKEDAMLFEKPAMSIEI